MYKNVHGNHPRVINNWISCCRSCTDGIAKSVFITNLFTLLKTIDLGALALWAYVHLDTLLGTNID